jgi:hypothetical protein
LNRRASEIHRKRQNENDYKLLATDLHRLPARTGNLSVIDERERGATLSCPRSLLMRLAAKNTA